MKALALETARLRLRPAKPSDLDPAAQMWSEEGVTRFIGGKPRTRQETWFALLRGAGLWSLRGFGYWAVLDRQTGEFVGEAGFADFQRGLPPDLLDGPEAGWAFAPRFWGQGLATEAVGAVHDWLDAHLPGASCCMIEPDNHASRRIARKAGYVETGSTLLGGATLVTYRRGASAASVILPPASSLAPSGFHARKRSRKA